MKTTMVIVAGLMVLATATFRVSTKLQDSNRSNAVVYHTELNKGSYLASEFAQFKKDNLREDLNVVVPVSDKVLFKAFVNYKKGIAKN